MWCGMVWRATPHAVAAAVLQKCRTLHITTPAAASTHAGVDLNLDHHRTAPWGNLFTNLHLGCGTRPFASGGKKTRGAYSGAQAGCAVGRQQRGSGEHQQLGAAQSSTATLVHAQFCCLTVRPPSKKHMHCFWPDAPQASSTPTTTFAATPALTTRQGCRCQSAPLARCSISWAPSAARGAPPSSGTLRGCHVPPSPTCTTPSAWPGQRNLGQLAAEAAAASRPVAWQQCGWMAPRPQRQRQQCPNKRIHMSSVCVLFMCCGPPMQRVCVCVCYRDWAH